MSHLPEPGIYCIEVGCPNFAMTERALAVTRDGDLVTELVCDHHAIEKIQRSDD